MTQMTKSSSDTKLLYRAKYSSSRVRKKNLADSKYLQMIHKALQQLGAEQVNVAISAEAKPPSDPKLAAIATLMGGGTEITLEEEIGA